MSFNPTYLCVATDHSPSNLLKVQEVNSLKAFTITVDTGVHWTKMAKSIRSICLPRHPLFFKQRPGLVVKFFPGGIIFAVLTSFEGICQLTVEMTDCAGIFAVFWVQISGWMIVEETILVGAVKNFSEEEWWVRSSSFRNCLQNCLKFKFVKLPARDTVVFSCLALPVNFLNKQTNFNVRIFDKI